MDPAEGSLVGIDGTGSCVRGGTGCAGACIGVDGIAAVPIAGLAGELPWRRYVPIAGLRRHVPIIGLAGELPWRRCVSLAEMRRTINLEVSLVETCWTINLEEVGAYQY